MEERDNQSADESVKDERPEQVAVNDKAAAETGQPEVSARKWQFYRNKKTLLILGGVLSTVLVGTLLWLFIFDKQESVSNQPVAQQERLLGAAVLLLDGTAQTSSDNLNWQDLVKDTSLQQGSYVRAASNGRVVIALDDGSVARVNSNSVVKLSDMSADNIVLENVAGEVYVRIVESERHFSVTVEDESYAALGTAYKTVHKAEAKGVEVYQSEVSVKSSDQKVSEGKRYFHENEAPELNKTVTDIPLDQLQKDEFLKWNLDQDKQNDEFKDKLGYLKVLEATPVAAAPTPSVTASPSAVNGITLSGSKTDTGVSLSWKVNGLSAPKGFKVVTSLETNPTFGHKKSESVYISDAAARNYTLTKKDGKTYYIRVCTYDGNGCTNYSNTVKVTAPHVAQAQPSGSLSLAHKGGNGFTWTLNGSAPHGHKLVWSVTPSPTYPESNAKFYNEGNNSAATIDAGSGSYYVRVCMYYEGGCKNYSNELYVTIP